MVRHYGWLNSGVSNCESPDETIQTVKTEGTGADFLSQVPVVGFKDCLTLCLKLHGSGLRSIYPEFTATISESQATISESQRQRQLPPQIP